MLTLLFDGVAYGMLLFILAVGLCVTMGLMNFINLAHGAFAMLGGYVSVTLLQRLGVPFLASLPLAFIAAAEQRSRRRFELGVPRGFEAWAARPPPRAQPKRGPPPRAALRRHGAAGG